MYAYAQSESLVYACTDMLLYVECALVSEYLRSQIYKNVYINNQQESGCRNMIDTRDHLTMPYDNAIQSFDVGTAHTIAVTRSRILFLCNDNNINCIQKRRNISQNQSIAYDKNYQREKQIHIQLLTLIQMLHTLLILI